MVDLLFQSPQKMQLDNTFSNAIMWKNSAHCTLLNYLCLSQDTMKNTANGVNPIIENQLVTLNLEREFQLWDIKQNATPFGNKRNTYYTSPTFDNNKSRAIYDKFLAYVCITETGDIAYGNNPKNYDCFNFIEYLSKILFNEIEIDYEYYQTNELE